MRGSRPDPSAASREKRSSRIGGPLSHVPQTDSGQAWPSSRPRQRWYGDASRVRTEARYSFDVAAAEGESPYFCVSEADFDDAAAMSAGRGSPEGQAVSADVQNYATGGVVVLDYELRGG